MRKSYMFRDGKLVEITPTDAPPRVYVVGDEMGQNVQNHADGKYYSSKSAFRRTTKNHGYVEVGNDRPTTRDDTQEHRRDVRRDLLENYERVLGS